MLYVYLYYQSDDNKHLNGKAELDEIYMGGRCKGKRGRGAGGKTPAFDMIERNDKALVGAASDVSSAALK